MLSPGSCVCFPSDPSPELLRMGPSGREPWFLALEATTTTTQLGGAHSASGAPTEASRGQCLRHDQLCL